ncbi:MAG: hypothetical protein M1514_02680 [Patescibacteria group bacterium]|nr:hypothetical protein [Patescibacteria group bacterium]
MLEFAHALTGAVIAAKVENPLVALPLCFFSHFVVDLLPHWNFHLDEEKNKFGRLKGKIIGWLFLDSFLGLFLGLWVAYQVYPPVTKSLVVTLGAFLGVLPDLLEAPFFLFGLKNKIIDRLLRFQLKHQFNLPFLPGMLFQIIYAILLILFAGLHI